MRFADGESLALESLRRGVVALLRGNADQSHRLWYTTVSLLAFRRVSVRSVVVCDFRRLLPIAA